MTFDEIIQRITRDASEKTTAGPFLVGVAGVPAAGKTTLSREIAASLVAHGHRAVALQMDGFHHYNDRLEELGTRKFKGRIDTFDLVSFEAMLHRLKAGEGGFWWPSYSREIHNPVREGALIPDVVDIAVVEGNYLFVDQNGWDVIGPMFDMRVFIDLDDKVAFDRLMERHMKGGRTPEEAAQKIRETDLPNAVFIREASALPYIRFAPEGA